MKVIKGDKIQIIKGKDRGKSGKVIKSIPADGTVVIDGLNVRKKTIRARKEGERGQIVEVPWPIRVENVMFVCGKCNKPTRVGNREEKGKKVRYCKKCKGIV